MYLVSTNLDASEKLHVSFMIWLSNQGQALQLIMPKQDFYFLAVLSHYNNQKFFASLTIECLV